VTSESRSGGLLASSLVHEGTPAKLLYVLHGIFGSGRNWASVIRRFVRARPEWGGRLVDLRQHGSSQGFEPPHTLAAAARDLVELAAGGHEAPAAILGHSFGGKVALLYGREHGAALERLWIIDSTPDARVPDGSAWHMLHLLQRLPADFASRDEAITRLRENQIPLATAQWMATNLEQTNDRYGWRFELAALEAMLRDFFDQDLWDVLENPPGNAHVHLVKAKESSVLSAEAVRRITELSSNGRVFLHHVDGGHWVNADNPEALLALLTRHM
jgi:pimeloyl-ACP methyl ester carboxylesterase